ncbi:malate dehydrogenase [Fistulifera solaris]|uniref:Malate dehydrogenase n=1 Tax=Fistulifera solaris TaxID=1519565 RepID=A0A1Z5JGX3_FISSO|nr:malate dehydrogenase [Fistulifera solaris]|eukprot:GAX13176.1 malate dehydrogenase [Fistulifera solaris]
MFVSRSAVSRVMSASARSMSTKVAVLGAAGGIGQPLSMLLKLCSAVDELSCYDVRGSPGVAADLSHIPTKASVNGYLGASEGQEEELGKALTGASVVVIPAGVPRKPGMTRDDLFNINAGIVKTLVEGCAEHCPDALIAIISNPVNSTVPIAAEILKAKGVYNPKKLCGVTTLDVIRANTFVGSHLQKDPATIDVPVIGGHAGITILPLFSQVPGFTATDEELEALTVRTQFGGDEVVKAKAGAGSATLSMAYAGFIFAENVVKAMKGEECVQCAFVESSLTDARFFASPCKFGPNGVEEVLPFGELSAYEKGWFDKMMPDLKAQIQKGIEFAAK